MTLLSFLVIITLLYNLRRDLKEQWFSMWCQTRISLSYHPKSSLVYLILAKSYLISSSPTTFFSPPPSWWLFRLVYWSQLIGLLLPPSSRLGPKSVFSMCIPSRSHWCVPLGWQIWLYLILSGISRCLLRLGAPWNPHLCVNKVLIGHQNHVPGSVPW